MRRRRKSSSRQRRSVSRGSIGRQHQGGDGDPSSGGSSGDDDESRRDSRRGSRRRSERRHGSRANRRRPRRGDDSSPSPDGSDRHRGHSRSSKGPTRWMKPDKFDGKGSYETFIYQFENCAKYNRWDSTDKVAHLRWSLSGIAAQLLWDTESLTYKELLEKLRNRFGGRGMEEKFQNELRCRRRTRGESLRELSQDIQRLMALAYPGEKSGLSEHIARDAFLCALDDPDFELKIREREPVDLDSAVKLAQRFEVFKTTVESSSNPRHKVNRHVTNEAEQDAVLVTTNLEARLTNIEQQIQGGHTPPGLVRQHQQPMIQTEVSSVIWRSQVNVQDEAER